MCETKKCYADLVRSEVDELGVGEALKPDLHGESLGKFRMTLFHVGKMSSRSFKTKTAIDGSVWVKRTA